MSEVCDDRYSGASDYALCADGGDTNLDYPFPGSVSGLDYRHLKSSGTLKFPARSGLVG